MNNIKKGLERGFKPPNPPKTPKWKLVSRVIEWFIEQQELYSNAPDHISLEISTWNITYTLHLKHYLYAYKVKLWMPTNVQFFHQWYAPNQLLFASLFLPVHKLLQPKYCEDMEA